ncbi:MAG TPA: hypothetical protein VHZ26_00925 [Caulobacteraceae bacterium]|nr:hypothetical protein [Caulobacteraceae bacterium]
MQSNRSSAPVGGAPPRGARDGADPSAMGAGAEIFRRLERRPRRRRWRTVVALCVLAAIGAGGVIGYQTLLNPNAAPSAARGHFVVPGN